MNYTREVLEIRKQRRVSVAKLAEITGIPVDRIYKWESGTGNPKAEDSKKLQGWLEKPEKVQENTSGFQGQKDKTIYNLSEAQLIQARAILILAERINSGGFGSASSDVGEGQKDGPQEDLHLASGSTRRRKKRGGI